MKLSDLRKACEILGRTPPSFDHIRESDKQLWSLVVARTALPMLLKVVETLAQYEDTRHFLCSVMERAGIEVGGHVCKESTRVSWDQYFMRIAQMVATRATCPRKSVGCVLVRDRVIISTGYNGSIRGMPHCTDVGCVMENDHCSSVIHAEINAIVQAACNGVRIEGVGCYVTASPCWNCFKVLTNAGVKRIVYSEFYRDEKVFGVAEDLGIEMLQCR